MPYPPIRNIWELLHFCTSADRLDKPMSLLAYLLSPRIFCEPPDTERLDEQHTYILEGLFTALYSTREAARAFSLHVLCMKYGNG